MKFIVTAGGQGTKLWPYSRESKPKHFQSLIGSDTLFAYNVRILLKEYSPEDIYISTKERYIHFGLEQVPEIPRENYIVEPDIKKNRGPGEGLAFLKLSILHPDEPFLIVQADCGRSPEDKYLEMIREFEKLVKRDKKLITGGIKATRPTIGIDYLKLGSPVDMETSMDFFHIQEFVERPKDYESTKKLVENFHVTTHSNHNCWYPNLMLEAYKKHRPDWHEALMKIRDVLGTEDEAKKIEKIYASMEAGSTEEVTKHEFSKGYMVLLPYKWSDIGSWNSLHEYYAKNGELYADGTVLALDSKNSLVKSIDIDKLIAVYGVQDLVVVDTKDVLLIVPKDKIDKIQEIQKELEKTKELSKYL